MKRCRLTVSAVFASVVFVSGAFGQFSITYFDNYNYDVMDWDYWEVGDMYRFWNPEYLADFTSGHTEPSSHYLSSIDVFDLRTGFGSLDLHTTNEVFTDGDWTPLKSIGDPAWYGELSPHHVYAAIFEGTVCFEEGDVLALESDDDSYIFLDDNTAWGEEILSLPGMHPFITSDPPLIITADMAGFHKMTVKFADTHETQCGIRITLNGAPLQAVRQVNVDIKPGSCPNPLNITDNGVLPVAVLGTEDFDVFTVDPASIRLEGVAPRRSAFEDVSTPVPDSDDACACTTAGPDSCCDLTLKFDTQAIVAALGQVSDRDIISLTLTGETTDGRPLIGTDCVVMVLKVKPLITSVVRDGVTDGQPVIVPGPSPRGLQEDSHAFMDRPLDESDTRNYHWESIPAELVGADYVMTYNEDKQAYYPDVSEVSYTVTLRKAARLYIFVDQRYAPFPWLTDGSSGAFFEDTGFDILLHEVGATGTLRPFDVFGADAAAGTYVLGASFDGSGSRNFYSIAAVGW